MNDAVSAPPAAPDPAAAPAPEVVAAPVATPAAPDPVAAAPTPDAPPAEPTAPVAPVAPEHYEFAVPEGVTLDAEVMTAFEGVARELDLPKGKAQSVIDKVAPVIAARQTAAFEAVKTDWGNQAKADKEFGGGALDANLATAKLALDEHFSPEFKNYLETTGLGNHPEMIRGLYRIGKTLAQDGAVRGRQASHSDASAAQRLFPNQA